MKFNIHASCKTKRVVIFFACETFRLFQTLLYLQPRRRLVISVMAEVTSFTTENVSQIQNCCSTDANGTESCKQSSAINGNSLNSVAARAADGNLGNEVSRPSGTEQPLDQSTVADDAGNSLDLLNGAALGNETNILSKPSEIRMNISNDQLQLSTQENQVGDTNTATEAACVTNKCPLNQLILANTLASPAQDNQDVASSLLPVPCMALTGNSTMATACVPSPKTTVETQLSGLVPHDASSSATVNLANNAAGSLPVTTGLSNTSSTMSTLKPSISCVISPQQNYIHLMPTVSTSDMTGATQTTNCTSTTCVPGNTWTSVALPKIPAPCPNSDIQKDDSMSSLSSANSLSLSQTPVTLSTPAILNSHIVPAANNMVTSSVAPVAIHSLVYKTEAPQLHVNVAPSVELTISSNLSLPVTASTTMYTGVPAAVNTLVPEETVSVPNDGTATSAITETQTSSPPLTKDDASVSAADSSNFVPEILTAFLNFTPCIKCNSLLVCSCPGPSSGGQCSNVASTTCSASCQGVCTCDGMTVDQTNVSNPCPPDVKPQIFPMVVSMQ